MRRIAAVGIIVLVVAWATMGVPKEIEITVYNKVAAEMWLTLETDSTADTLKLRPLEKNSIRIEAGRYRYCVWNLKDPRIIWPIDWGVFNFGADYTFYVWYNPYKREFYTEWNGESYSKPDTHSLLSVSDLQETEVTITIYNKVNSWIDLILRTHSTADILTIQPLEEDNIRIEAGTYKYRIRRLGPMGYMIPIESGVRDFLIDCTLYVKYHQYKREFYTEWEE